MSVIFNEAVYGITALGRKVKIGFAKNTVENAYKMGGKIFYIDPAGGLGAKYHFYNEYGEELQDVKVGDEPYAYIVDGNATTPKYYIAHTSDTVASRWTYFSNGEYVYENTGATKTGIGGGKQNTSIVMALNNGAYITDDSNGINTIWYRLKIINDTMVEGHNDWFIPNKDELDALKSAIDRDGKKLTDEFSKKYLWTSYQASNQAATYWRYDSDGGKWDNQLKDNPNYYVLPIRSF